MKKINIQKIILVLIPVLFIFSGAAKADTFTYNGYTFTTQTDKPIYTEGANGGGDTATVIVSLNQSPSPKLMGANSSYSIQSFSSKANMYAESPQNYFSSATSYNNYSNNSYSSYSFSFEVGTTATSSQAAAYNNYYSYWDTARDYRVVNSLELIPYSGPHDYINPYVWFNVKTTQDNCIVTTTSTTTSTSTQSGSSGGSNNTYTEYMNDNLSRDAVGISYVDTNGTSHSNESVAQGQSICALDGSGGGGDFGWLRILGDCTPQSSGGNASTTTTTTTTNICASSTPPAIFSK